MSNIFSGLICFLVRVRTILYSVRSNVFFKHWILKFFTILLPKQIYNLGLYFTPRLIIALFIRVFHQVVRCFRYQKSLFCDVKIPTFVYIYITWHYMYICVCFFPIFFFFKSQKFIFWRSASLIFLDQIYNKHFLIKTIKVPTSVKTDETIIS